MKKTKKESDFNGIWIPKEILLDEELTLTEKVYLSEIVSLDDNQECFASNHHFAILFGSNSPTSVSNIIRSLKDKGYIKTSYIRNGKNVKKRIIEVLKNNSKQFKENSFEHNNHSDVFDYDWLNESNDTEIMNS